jgi:hypothetical protein
MVEDDEHRYLPASGEHRVRLTIDGLFTSREVVLQIRAGWLAEFVCRP